MRYAIILAPQAVEDLETLSARHRKTVMMAIQQCLRYEPEKVSRSRIKRLRGIDSPQYRLCVDEIRVFYDVRGDRVDVIAIIPKAATAAWLEQQGESP